MRLQGFPLLIVLMLTAVAASAQTRYVSDELTITLRTGPSTQNQILRNLTSGAAVEVLQELPDEGYTRVRTTDGTEGWVISRYLQTERIAAQRLTVAERDLAQARERIGTLEAQVAELSGSLDETTHGEPRAICGSTCVDWLRSTRSREGNRLWIEDPASRPAGLRQTRRK